MSEETQKPHYRGVTCLHCGQPIPLPPRVAALEVALTDGEPNRSRPATRRFAVWCRACRKEAPYSTGSIVDFQGLPGVIKPRPRPVVAPWRRNGFFERGTA